MMGSKCSCQDHRSALIKEMRNVAHRLRGPVGVLLSMEEEVEALPRATAEIFTEAVSKLHDLVHAYTEKYKALLEEDANA